MQPELNINYIAVIVCALLAMPVGFLWFGPLFGRAWARGMGMADLEQAGGSEMARSMIIFAVGNLLIAWVVAHSVLVWRPSTWGAGEDAAAWVYGLNAAFWTWIGFFVPLQIGRVAWEKRGWSLVGINASFDLTRLLIFAFVLAYWR